MSEQEKNLESAMRQIKEILEKKDIGGIVVLHVPGICQSLAVINPSYSCAKICPDGKSIHMRAKLLQDFNGNKKAWAKKVTDTSSRALFTLTT